MLNYFNSFVVPGVPGVTIFMDDQDDSLFYMVKEWPTVATGADGEPMFNLIAFARDFRLSANANTNLSSQETEGGLMSVTLELVVSQEDQDKIRKYIQEELLGHPLLCYLPILRGSDVFISLRRPFTKPIKLAYPIWTEGTSTFYPLPATAGETFIKGVEGSKSPSLTGNNISNYTVMLGQEGVRLFREAVENGWSPGTINYDLKYIARIPNLTVTVTGNTRDVYDEIKQHSTIVETYRQGNNYSQWTYPAVSSLDELRSMVTSLHITVDSGDFRSDVPGGTGQEITNQINQLAFNLIQNYLQNTFFSHGFEPGLKAEKLGTDPFAHNPSGKPPAPANQLWLKDFHQEWNAEINFSFTARQNIQVQVHPNTSLFSILPPEEVKKRIIEADLSTPYFQILDVPVRVTANFEKDPIAAITVFMEYNERDDKTGETKNWSEAFTFDTGHEVFRFRTVMARDSQGAPKDTYCYKSRITYKASSKAEEIPERTTSDRSLILGYDELDFVQVQVTWGAISSALVDRVQIDFNYPGVNLPTSTAQIFLTPQQPEAQWFTYTGGNPSRDYNYQVTYFMNDGQRMQLPQKTDSANGLVINAPFDDRLRVTFVPQGTFPPINSIVVSAHYRDPDPAASYEVDDVHTFTSLRETWTWEPSLRNRTARAFEYKVTVTYNDGSAHEGEWVTDGKEGTLLVGDVAREMLEIEMVPTLLDMNATWKLVVVRLNYKDPANNLDLTETFKITASNANNQFVWKVPIKNKDIQTFSYTIQAFGYDQTNKKVIGPVDSEETPVIMEF